MATVWPITAAELRKALGYDTTQGDTAELTFYAAVACERIDTKTGRDADPTRHLKTNGDLPLIFVLAARETAKLWWLQKAGPRGRPGAPEDAVPMGADLPRKVEGWLSPYPAPPGFGQAVSA